MPLGVKKIMTKRISILLIILAVFIIGLSIDSEGCEFDEYHLAPLLIDTQSILEKCKYDLDSAVFNNALVVVDKYWNTETSSSERYMLLAESYKKRLSKYDQIKSASEYSIPLSEYERIWSGYKIIKISIIDKDRIQVSIQQKWEQEGYEGVMTYIMSLYKGKKTWKIQGIHF